MGQNVQVIGALHGITSEMKTAVGRPMEDVRLPKPACYDVRGKAIDWNDFNYPPLLEVVHYDVNELPEKAASITRCLNLVYRLITVLCLLNFVDTIIVTALVGGPWTWIVSSVLNLSLLPTFGFLVFYTGYRGLAEQDATLLGRFTLAKIALGILCVLMALLPWGCINGLFRFTVFSKYHVEGGAQIFWTIVIFLESGIWLAVASLCALNLFRIRNYDRAADMESGLSKV